MHPYHTVQKNGGYTKPQRPTQAHDAVCGNLPQSPITQEPRPIPITQSPGALPIDPKTHSGNLLPATLGLECSRWVGL